jgi:hypothetical protein
METSKVASQAPINNVAIMEDNSMKLCRAGFLSKLKSADTIVEKAIIKENRFCTQTPIVVMAV